MQVRGTDFGMGGRQTEEGLNYILSLFCPVEYVNS